MIPYLLHATIYANRDAVKHAVERCTPQTTPPRHVINISAQELLPPDPDYPDVPCLPDDYPCQCGEKNSGRVVTLC